MPPALTDAHIRAAKPAAKPQRLYDSGGLYLEVSPAGGKLWRLKYRHAGKEKRLSLGTWPATSLRDARARAVDARRLLEDGTDPGEAKRQERQAETARTLATVEAASKSWVSKAAPSWSDSHRARVERALRRDILPFIGGRPLASITPVEVIGLVDRVAGRGTTEVARRVGQVLSGVYQHAVAAGLATHDPVPSVRKAFPSHKTKHRPAITEPAELGAFLRALGALRGTPNVMAALRLQVMLMARPGELRVMRWTEVDLDRAAWSYTVGKSGADHLVPLPAQAVTLLRELHTRTGTGAYVFPGRSTLAARPMSEATMGAAIGRMGYDSAQVTAHGFRATSRTLLAERLGFRAEVIEHQLAHAVPDALGRAYNRSRFLEERRRMLQSWADYCDELERGGQVIQLRGNSAA